MKLSTKQRRWLVFSAAVAIPLAVIGVAYVINCWRAHSMLRREIALIEQRGEPVWFADLAPPHDDEAVARGIAMARLLDGFNRVPSEDLDQAATRTLTKEEANQLRQLVDGYRSDLQAILDLLHQGDCRFEYDYHTREPYRILLPHVQNLRIVQGLLQADLHANLTLGQPRQAVRELHDMFRLDHALRRDPFSVSQRVRKALVGMALDNLRVILAQGVLREEDIPPLSERLQEVESHFRLADCLRAERALMLVTVENLGRPAMTELLTDQARDRSPREAAVLNYWWASWPYRPRRLYEESVMLRTMSEWADLVDQPGPAATQRLRAVLAEIREEDFPIFHEWSAHFANPDLREAGLAHRERLLAADVALKIYDFRARHGRLPESLDDLDGATPKERNGLLSGKPLIYEPTTDGFVLYDDLPEQGRFEVKFARDPEEP